MVPTKEQAIDAIIEGIDDPYKVVDEIDTRSGEYSTTIYILKHIESGKHYKMGFHFLSWDGLQTDYFDVEPHEVEQKEILVKKWVAV